MSEGTSRRHVTFAREPTTGHAPDLGPVREIVSERVWRAMQDASAELARLGVRSALVGGLAVGAYGFPRATKDVDFLVDETAWQPSPAGLLVMRVGLPVEAHGVAIDTLPIRSSEPFLRAAMDGSISSEGVPVAPVEVLFYMKLLSPRHRDRTDIIELVKRGADVPRIEAFIDAHAPALRPKLDDAVRTAREEEEL